MHFIGTTKDLGSCPITKTAGILRGVYPEREMIKILRSAQEDSEGLRMTGRRPSPATCKGFGGAGVSPALPAHIAESAGGGPLRKYSYERYPDMSSSAVRSPRIVRSPFLSFWRCIPCSLIASENFLTVARPPSTFT